MTSFRSLALVSLVALLVAACSKDSAPPTAPTPVEFIDHGDATAFGALVEASWELMDIAEAH